MVVRRSPPGGPLIVTADDFKNVVLPEPRAAERQKIIADMYKPYAANEQYPNVAKSNEELQEITTIETDIQALVKEKRAKRIVSGGIDTEWDAYTKQLTTIGLDRMMKIYQDAYDRYVKK
jgi:putative aldouronate transport system substrate-binding protein